MRNVFKFITTSLVVGMVLCSPLTTFAKAGCCSKHGGVAGCDSSSGFLKCKDGTLSKTCKCNGTTATKPYTTKSYKSKSTSTQPSASTSSSTAATATTAAAATTATMKAPKGCCSRHGGVASCNTKTGYFMCKDGTQSTTCKCS